MSEGLQRAKDSFVVIDGDHDTRRGIMIGGDKILTALHNLRQNRAFDIFLPENNSNRGARVDIEDVTIHAAQTLDTAITHIPEAITDKWAEVAGGKSLLRRNAARHVITDASGAIGSRNLSIDKDMTDILQDIFDDSRMGFKARNFEVFKTNARIRESDSGSPIVDRKGRVVSVVSGVIDNPNKGLGSKAWGAFGGKVHDIYAPQQNAVAHFLQNTV